MSPPTPPSPPIISRREEDEHRTSSRSHHRTARDYRASRSRSRGPNTRSSRSADKGNRHRQRPSHSKSRSRDREANRYQSSSRRYRQERSRSKSKGRSERRRQRSRSRSYSKSTRKSSHRSRSRSKSQSRTRRRNNRSRSRSKEARASRSHSRRRDDRGESSKKANVIVLSTESYKDSLKSSSRLPKSREDTAYSTTTTAGTSQSPSSSQATPSWKTVKTEQVGVYSNLEPDEPIDKEKIHKEIEEKLRIALAREGKVYPYPKPEPSHPVFANDGSFLEIFKKMQQQQTFVQQQVGESMQIHAVPAAPVAPILPAIQPHQPPPPQLPVFGRRRGGKILKTGVVAKPKAQNDAEGGDVKDFWSIYLREVKKYKSTACESDSKTRPLVR